MTELDDQTFKQLLEGAELDKRAEWLVREEMCAEKGHDIKAIHACARCGQAFYITGQDDSDVC